MSEDEIEKLLKECRLRKEEGKSTVGTVTAQGQVQAVCPVSYCGIVVEGVPVQAMVDTGSQSIIISRSKSRQSPRRVPRSNVEAETQEVFVSTGVCILSWVHNLGISPDDTKIAKVNQYPVPKDVTQVRQFLGLASYYRHFIANFARIASPLHALTKKVTNSTGPQVVKMPSCT